jgi:pimeloyl-ACP methyl ester carboxylesterase
MAVVDLPAHLARDLPQVEGVRHRLAEVGGVHLHFAEAGAGDPIVLQHGWPQHWYTWRHVIPELALTRRVIAPDLRGFGWSEAPRDSYEKETFASDLIGLLDALELDQVDLIAHDWGGFAGFLAALRAPHRFRRFLALGITHPWIQPDPAALVQALPSIAYQFVLATPLLGELALIASPDAVASGIPAAAGRPIDPDAIRSYATRLQERARARASSQLYRTFLTRELPAIVQGRYAGERLTVPTRLLIGSADPVIKVENLAGYEDHADDMQVTELQGIGHFIPDEDPAYVLEHARTLFGEPAKASTNGARAPEVEAYVHPERQHVEVPEEEVAEAADAGAEEGAGAEVHVDEPWEGYDEMTVQEVKDRLRDASPELAAIVRLYEATHKNRTGVLKAVGDDA